MTDLHDNIYQRRDDVLFPKGQDLPPFEFPKKGTPGNIITFGPNTFPLVEAGTQVVVAAATTTSGSGKIVALAHEGYLDGGKDALVSSKSQLFHRIALWMGGWDNILIFGGGSATVIRYVKEHLAAGGGVLVADCPWGWLQLNPGKTLDQDHAKNQFLSEFGLAFTDDYCHADGPFVVSPSSSCDTPMEVVHRNPLDLVAAFPKEEDLTAAREAYSQGGWWAVCSNDPSMTFCFSEAICLAAVKVWTVNINACPKKMVVYVSDDSDGDVDDEDASCWGQVASFSVETSNDAGKKQNIPHMFQFSAVLPPTRRIRLQWHGIHNDHYIGINDVWIYTIPPKRNGPILSASALRCIPAQARQQLIENLQKDCARSSGQQPRQWPSPDHPIGGVNTADGRACLQLHALASIGDAASMAALKPAADIFPGIVPHEAKSAPVLSLRCEASSDGGGQVWHSTHRYARPGERIDLSIVSSSTALRGGKKEAAVRRGQWRLKIGCHSDDIGMLPEWHRMPSITTLSDIVGTSASCVSPFGGLVFVEQCSVHAPSIDCSISGGVVAPHFIQGHEFCDGPAPWGEITGELVSLCLPRTELVKAQKKGDLPAAITFWDSVVRHHHELSSPPYGNRRERIVTDVQLSCGYMHSGYPIMAHMDFASRALNVEKLVSEGDWGMFHELGHNHQKQWWTWDATTEVTVNLFTMYTMEHLIGRSPDNMSLLGTDKGRTKVQTWVDSGKPRSGWNKDPFLALYLYSQLIDAFGWSVLKEVFRTYEENPPKFDRASGDDKMAEWASRYSQIARHDLQPFFEAWGFRVPAQKSLPPWTCALP